MAAASASLGPTRRQIRLRGLLVAGYAAIVVLGFTTQVQPRLFWTVLLPLLPITIVLIGFATWRRICPLAWFGEVGRKLNRGKQRRVPRWLERWFFVVTFSALLVMLVVRLVATNGDGAWLGGLLVVLAFAALVTNAVFTGKSWCNFFCPVGFVERVYTEPRSLPTTPSSQCARCTACKSSCPDIDPENAYWRDLPTAGRRLATFAFPGLVLGFYTYYWLRHGDWEAYFDGRWTRLPVSAELVLGPGWFFAPGFPAVAAALLTLVGFCAASFALFALVEATAGRLVADDERRRHLMLALAAFSAFSIFYVFAGAPTLRRIAGAQQAMAFVAPMLGTLFLVKRWVRTRESFIREKGAAKLLRDWPFDEPPPEDPREVYGWIKGGEHAHERSLKAYASTVREMIADGLVRRGELRLLEGVRTQLGISQREHDKVLERLSEEERELFLRDDRAGVEERAQLEGYEVALADALLHHADETEVAELQRAFGVDAEAHRRLLERMRGESGVLLERARRQVERLRGLRGELAAIAVAEPTEAEAFLTYLLLREQGEALQRLLDVFELLGDGARLRALRPCLLGDDAAARREAARQLVEACPGAGELAREVEPWIVERAPSGAGARDRAGRDEVLKRRAGSSDRYVRAAAEWVAGGAPRATGAGFSELPTIEKMQFLRRVELFATLDPEDLDDLAVLVEEREIDAPDVLCEEGDVAGDDLFVILDGRASVVVGAGAQEREVAVLGPGEVVGEMSMIDRSPRSATVRPKDGPVRVLRVPGPSFRNRLLPRARVSRPLLVTLARRIREMSHRSAGR